MASFPVAHGARVALTFAHSTVTVRGEMTFWVQDTSDAIFAAPATFAAAVYAAATAHLLAQLAPAVVLDGIVFEDARALPYVGADFPQGPNAGTLAGGTSGEPTSCCIAIGRTTGGLGRSQRGRLYWPVWDNAPFVAADTLGTVYVGNVIAALTAFQTAVEAYGATVKLGIVSFQHGGAPVNPGVFRQVTAWSASDVLVDSQRRRLLGRGP